MRIAFLLKTLSVKNTIVFVHMLLDVKLKSVQTRSINFSVYMFWFRRIQTLSIPWRSGSYTGIDRFRY